MIFNAKVSTYIYILEISKNGVQKVMIKKHQQKQEQAILEEEKAEALKSTLSAAEQAPQENVEPTQDEATDSGQDKLVLLAEEVQKWKELAMRSQAEMENLRKRTQIDVEKAHRYATAGFAKELLNVADCLAGAIECAKKEIEATKTTDKECQPFLKNLLTGVEMTQKQLMTAFEKNGIQKMETLGLVFDPNLHKVIQEVEDDSKEAGTIVQELQSGYTIAGDRVLREAMVIVSK